MYIRILKINISFLSYTVHSGDKFAESVIFAERQQAFHDTYNLHMTPACYCYSVSKVNG